MSLLPIIHEQLLEYSRQLKELEKEIIRKYKAGDEYSADLRKAAGLKMLQEECVRMMVKYQQTKNKTNDKTNETTTRTNHRKSTQKN